jgi:hypothetical protein
MVASSSTIEARDFETATCPRRAWMRKKAAYKQQVGIDQLSSLPIPQRAFVLLHPLHRKDDGIVIVAVDDRA